MSISSSPYPSFNSSDFVPTKDAKKIGNEDTDKPLDKDVSCSANIKTISTTLLSISENPSHPSNQKNEIDKIESMIADIINDNRESVKRQGASTITGCSKKKELRSIAENSENTAAANTEDAATAAAAAKQGYL